MSDPKIEQTPFPSRSPRSGAIELLQVFSLLMLPVAYLLPDGWYRATAVGAAIVLGLIPFLLIQLPERESSRTWSRGFKITSERLRTLKELGIPNDILQSLESSSMKGIYYPKSKDFRKVLVLVIGRERAKPYLETILLHTQYDGDPPAPISQAGEAKAPSGPGDLRGAQPSS